MSGATSQAAVAPIIRPMGIMVSASAPASKRSKRRNMPIGVDRMVRSEEHTSELQSLMRISYAVFCLKKKIQRTTDRSNRSRRLDTRPQLSQCLKDTNNKSHYADHTYHHTYEDTNN